MKSQSDDAVSSDQSSAETSGEVWQDEQQLLQEDDEDAEAVAISVTRPVECIESEAKDLVFEPLDNVENSDNIWSYISNNLQFHTYNKVTITNHKLWYLDHPTYLTKITKRAAPYIGYIVERLEQEKMPVDIALLPIVESAYNPFAYSHGRASGLWQFIPMTGERFKLEQNWWYDGRRDVIRSTDAAISYLKYLNNYFDGDWLLALAAYNAGEGTVRKAINKNIAKNYPTDFFSLKLPEETTHYVPKLIALSQVFHDLSALNTELFDVAVGSSLAVVDVGGQIDLSLMAELGGLPVETIQMLNPGYNRWATSPDGPHQLVVPLELADTYTKKLSELDPKKRMKWVRYKVRSGDSLIKIANQFGTKTSLIRQVNNIQSQIIRIGDLLMIPVAAKSLDQYTLSQSQRLARSQSKSTGKQKVIHVVSAGDTLWDISRDYKVNHRNIAKWNGMAPGDTLKLGQKLVIWQKGAAGNNITKLQYRVRKGDSLSTISSRFNVKVADVKKWNTTRLGRYIHPGQVLILYVDVTEQS